MAAKYKRLDLPLLRVAIHGIYGDIPASNRKFAVLFPGAGRLAEPGLAGRAYSLTEGGIASGDYVIWVLADRKQVQDTLAHEASHVATYILDETNMLASGERCDELRAALVGWIVGELQSILP